MKKFRFLALMAMVCALALSFSSCGSDDEPKKDPQVENPTDTPTDKPEAISLDGKVYVFTHVGTEVDGMGFSYTDVYDFSFKKTEAKLFFEQYSNNDDGAEGGNETCYYKYTVDPKTGAIKLTASKTFTEFDAKYQSSKTDEVLSKLKVLNVSKDLGQITFQGYTPYRGEQTLVLKLKK